MDPNKTIQNKNKLKFLQQFTESKSDEKDFLNYYKCVFHPMASGAKLPKRPWVSKSAFVIEVAHESFLGAILFVQFDWKDTGVKEGTALVDQNHLRKLRDHNPTATTLGVLILEITLC